MPDSERGTRPETVLLVGGAISMLAIAGQLVSLYQESDLSTPTGRFRAMAVAIGHFPPLLGALTLLLAGSWHSDQPVRRGVVAACVGIVVLLCLTGIPFMVPDALHLSSGVLAMEVSRFRGQVIRELLYLVSIALVLWYALWKYLRRTPLVVGE